MAFVVSRPVRRSLTAGLIGAAAGGLVALASHLGTLDALERRGADLSMALRGVTEIDERIAILTIDESSIATLGQFPWPRSIHAATIQTLDELGADTIVFDVLFVDPDRSGHEQDAALGSALEASESTVLAGFFAQVANGKLVSLRRPLPELLRHAEFGHANLTPDEDGVLREIPLEVETEAERVPSLALAAFAATESVSVSAALDKVPIEARSNGRLRLNFPGSAAAFPTFSYATLLQGEVPRAAIEGRTIFIGGTASSLFDTAAVPGQPVAHGVSIHAVALDNLLRKAYLQTLPHHWITLVLVLLGLARGVSLTAGRAVVQALITLALIGACIAASVVTLERANLLLPLVSVVTTLLGAHISVDVWRLGSEERERRWIDRTFGQYLSPKIIALLKSDPERLNLGGEKRELTVMFIDLAGFTAASTRLDAEQLARLLNEFLSEMSDVVLEHDGVIDKFLGDGMMAFWNAPVDQADHAARACRSALEQVSRFAELRDRWKSEGLPPLGFRIGISTGLATVGNFGSRTRFDYTAIGETVNLAARLEAANKVTGTTCMVCERTREQVGGAFRTRPLGELKLHGLDALTPAFELEALETAARA